jgi:hypothetical protein
MATPDDVRIIICGPRDNPHQLTAERLVLALKRKHGDRLTIVHGGCPTGTDAHVHAACIKFAVRVEVNPADWEQHGKPGGPIRNRGMAARGAEACFAVTNGVADPVRGTLNMLEAARKEHITPFAVKTNSVGNWRIEAWPTEEPF